MQNREIRFKRCSGFEVLLKNYRDSIWVSSSVTHWFTSFWIYLMLILVNSEKSIALSYFVLSMASLVRSVSWFGLVSVVSVLRSVSKHTGSCQAEVDGNMSRRWQRIALDSVDSVRATNCVLSDRVTWCIMYTKLPGSKLQILKTRFPWCSTILFTSCVLCLR